MRVKTLGVVLLVFSGALSGCFSSGGFVKSVLGSPFEDLCEEGIPETTWYHYANATDATTSPWFAETAVLEGSNAPVCTEGTYFGIGMTTFEPTIGVTSSDNLYMSSYGNGPAGSTAIVQCSGLIGMVNVSDYACVNVYDALAPVPNSNDHTSTWIRGLIGS